MANKWTQRTVSISRKYSDEEREAIAFDIVAFLQKRAKSGKGKDGKKFPKYSDAYKKSLAFKIGGKSSKVNLTLSGDMLDSIDHISDNVGEIKIGLEDGDEDEGKAEGNIRGTYGQKKGNRSMARDFLAMSKTEVDRILNRYPIKDEEKRKKSLSEYASMLTAFKKKVDDA